MNVHSDVKPFGCDLCAKRFTQNKSLTRHKKVHADNPVTCSMCDKTCQTLEQIYTHFRGAHGKGYRAPCGEQYQWPAAWARHQGDCTPCKHHLELRKLKKKFPMPFKKEESARTVKQEKQEQERNEWTILHYVCFVCANMWNGWNIYFIVVCEELSLLSFLTFREALSSKQSN